MNSAKKLGLVSGGAIVLVLGLTAFVTARQSSLPAPFVKIEVKDGYRYITSNGIPNHAVGAFPNRNNPNSITAQKYSFKVPLKPTPAGNARVNPMATIGVAINGVPFDPGTAEFWNGDRQWTFEALSGYEFTTRGGLGVDQNLAHVQPNGAYHYHGLPYGLLEKLDYKHKMVLVGFAADGYPVYGPYCYSNPNDPKSGLRWMKTSYKLKSGNRPDGPGGAYDGSFKQDYLYTPGSGDLDDQNGRTGITPEYPNGTYYYVITDKFPFMVRTLKGSADPSFAKGPGGGPPGGPGGRRRFGPPGGPGGGPGGFGPPPGGGGFGPPPGGGPGGGPGQGGADQGGQVQIRQAAESLKSTSLR